MKHAPRARTAALLIAVALVAACGKPGPEAQIASARADLQRRDPQAAIVRLKTVLQDQPESGPARLLLGRALFEQGDPASAAAELQKALDLKHPPSEVLPTLARAMLQQGLARKLIEQHGATTLPDTEANAELRTTIAAAHYSLGARAAGDRELDAALAASPQSAPARNLRTRVMAIGGQIPAAIALNDEVLKALPQDPEAWQLRGMLLLASKKDSAGALAAYRKSLSFHPRQPGVHEGVVALLMRDKQLDAAEAQVAEMRKVLPTHPLTYLLAGQVALAKKDYPKAKDLAQRLMKNLREDPAVLLFASEVEFRAGSLRQAETHLGKLLGKAPDNAGARQLFAQVQLRLGQAPLALETLRPLLEQPAVPAQTLVAAATAHLQLGDNAAAEAFYVRASKADPDDVRSRIALALSQIGRGQTSGFAELDRLSEADTGGIDADLAAVAAHARRKEFDAALKAVDRIEKKQPGKALSAHLQGRMLRMTGDRAGARRSFERALQIDSQYVIAAADLAELDVAEQQPQKARARLEAILTANPRNEAARLALIDLYARSDSDTEAMLKLINEALAANPMLSRPRLLLVHHYLRTNKVALAMAAAQDGIAAKPGSPELLDALAQAQSRMGDTQQAIVTYNKLAALQPKSAFPHLRLAAIHARNKNQAGALQSLNKALAIAPELLLAQRALVSQHLGENKHADALAVARLVRQQRPKEPAGYVLEGDIEADRRAWSAAIVAYRAGLKNAPSTELAVRLHGMLIRNGKPDEAQSFASAWRAEHPKDALFVLGLGEQALAGRKLPEAEKYFREALQRLPDSPMALNNLAFVLAMRGEPESIALAERAIKLKPNEATLYDTLSLAQASNKQLERAIETQKKAIDLTSDQDLMRLRLAKLYLQADRKALAKEQLQQLEARSAIPQVKTEAKELLKTL
ncbi:PEP-CTERM system TPR-repeat protein PrsT [Aquincola sp. S2]|uniref:PEP-CTERM system TPR-repeat protein PrsT n=1 Tax=Pseudaquabacterium terrae TaxID=2732868 RepID=A0ABX2EDM6_9BURK|nr:XrtA/PEP-CTERM system TPR-repeat protein PrsT [Aquabacterium terrae]NRF66490.1 PEP-CTERM system TPR-repeat protein PrsT [Aquabacterium terrae]